MAYLVTYPDASVTAEDLRALCRANLTEVKIPTAIYISHREIRRWVIHTSGMRRSHPAGSEACR